VGEANRRIPRMMASAEQWAGVFFCPLLASAAMELAHCRRRLTAPTKWSLVDAGGAIMLSRALKEESP